MVNQFSINNSSSLKRLIHIFLYFGSKKISNLFLQYDKEKDKLEFNIDNNNNNNNINLYNLKFEKDFFESVNIDTYVLIPINSIYSNLKKISKNKKSFPSIISVLTFLKKFRLLILFSDLLVSISLYGSPSSISN